MAMLILALAVLGALLDTTKDTLRKKVIISVLFLIMMICATLLLFLLLKSQWEKYFSYLQEVIDRGFIYLFINTLYTMKKNRNK